MTEIFLIRHTHAEGNLYRMTQGHWDGDITDLGRKQIDALALRFKDEHIDAVYSSDLYRARMTAEAITRYHFLPIRVDTRLREINVGPWEAQFFGNTFYDYPKDADDFVHHPSQWRVPGAETYEQVKNRARTALINIGEKNDGKRVAVVSHGVTIRCLMSACCGMDLDDVDSLPIYRNTSVTKLIYDKGTFTPVYVNDTSHLPADMVRGWTMAADLRDVPIDPMAEREYYASCYAKCWQAAHGSLTGYRPQVYLEAAAKHYLADKGSILMICDVDEPVGLVDLDTQRGESEGFGWISLLYLREDYRGKGNGIQLLARALVKYSSLGRREVRLHVAEENTQALNFYLKNDFKKIGEEGSGHNKLYLMSRPLGKE